MDLETVPVRSGGASDSQGRSRLAERSCQPAIESPADPAAIRRLPCRPQRTGRSLWPSPLCGQAPSPVACPLADSTEGQEVAGCSLFGLEPRSTTLRVAGSAPTGTSVSTTTTILRTPGSATCACSMTTPSSRARSGRCTPTATSRASPMSPMGCSSTLTAGKRRDPATRVGPARDPRLRHGALRGKP